MLRNFQAQKVIGNSEHPLQKVELPCDEKFRGMEVDTQQITFKQLLTHTSGLPAWRSVYNQCGPIPAPIIPKEEIAVRQERALKAVESYQFFTPPNYDVIYSDIGLIWLGFAIQAVCGKPLEQCLEDLVLKPLNLTARFNPHLSFSKPAKS